MNILVVSHSNVVMELLKIVFKENSLKSEHIKTTEGAKSDSYTIIFLDDSSPNYKKEIENIRDNFSYNKLVFIGKLESDLVNFVDYVIKKPFLPKDIKEIIDNTKENSQKIETKILDPNEIARIKALMDLEIEEEDDEEKSVLELLKKREDLTLKTKKAKEFLYECTNMTKKELKKLLKGAKISVKIKFKRDRYE